MNELKTLKETKESLEGYPEESDMVSESSLKEEAINDIKMLYRIKNFTIKEAQKLPDYMSCCTNYPLCSMGQGLLVCGEDKKQIEPIIKYIMWKFNLTEDDLK